MTLDELIRLQGGEPAGSESSGSSQAHGGPGLAGSGGADVGLAGFRPGWLPGPAAGPGAACDATIIPVVTGRVDPVLLDQLAAKLRNRSAAVAQQHAATAGYDPAVAGHDPAVGSQPSATGAPPEALSAADARQAARDLVLADAVRLLSGPGGLAAALRAGVPCPPAAAASLPLDIGKPSDTIPPHLRRAVIVRDRTCRFPGCQQPAAACDVHHVVWRTRGGRTELVNLVLLCRFHHLIVIHQWGWTITLHPDATVTAVSPDGRRTLRSHSPPGTLAA